MIAPFPNNPNLPEDFDPKYDMDISGNGLMWYARPQLFFNCTVCPTAMRGKKHSHLELSLVYFRTFEPINITPPSVMQHIEHNGVPMLYDIASSSNEPSLYICPVSNVLGSVPLIPCFVAGNKHPTLLHRDSFCSSQRAIADTHPGAGNGSRLFELSPWMWRYTGWRPRGQALPAKKGIQVCG